MRMNASVMVVNVNAISPVVRQVVDRILMEGQCLGQVEEKSCQSGETLTRRNRKCWSKFFYWILTSGNFRMIYFWSYIGIFYSHPLFSQSNYNDIVDQFLPNVFKALFSVSLLTEEQRKLSPFHFQVNRK